MMPLDTIVVRPDGMSTVSGLQTPDALDMALDKIMQAKVQVCCPLSYMMVLGKSALHGLGALLRCEAV